MNRRLPRVGIRDVAKAAGVSVSTISKVLNGRDGIAEGTQARVLAVVDELGYARSIGAQGLRARRTGVIGVLMPEFEPYSTEVLKGLAEGCQSSGYELLAWSAGMRSGTTGWERRLLARLAGSLIDAAVLVTPSVAAVRLDGFPLVAVDPHEGPGLLPCVHSDDHGGAVQAVEHLAALGHHRIGFLGGRAGLASAEARQHGFAHAVAKLRLDTSAELVRHGDYTPAGAEPALRALLSLDQRPTAIVAANDMSALRVIELATAAGLSVPADLSVLGFDDIPEAAAAGLTTIAQPLRELGLKSMGQLLALLGGGPEQPDEIVLPTRLVVRTSTSPAPETVRGQRWRSRLLRRS